MLYDGEPVELTADQEEVANMFGVMKETDYMKKQIFLDNFWNDFRKVQRLITFAYHPIHNRITYVYLKRIHP